MPILLTAAVIVSLSMGIRQTMGLFLGPVSAEMGTGRELFSFAIALQNLCWGLASPVFGALADKYGPSRITVLGGFIYMAGLAMMTGLLSPFGLVAAQILIGVGMGSAGMSIALGAVARAAPREHQSLALGLVTSFGSFGQFALIPASQWAINGFGWQTAMLMLTFATLGIVAAGFGLRGTDSKTGGPDILAGLKVGDALATALRSRNYVLLTLGFFVCGVQVMFIGTHLPAYLNDVGLDSQIASWALALIGLFNIIGSLLCGWLGGHYSKRKVLAFVYLLRSVVILIFFSLPPSPASALLFGAAIGLLWLGTIPLTSALIVVFFGPAFLSMLYGMVFLSHQVGSFIGAWAGGFVYDMTGTYDLVWWLTILTGLFAFVVHWMINEEAEEARPAPV